MSDIVESFYHLPNDLMDYVLLKLPPETLLIIKDAHEQWEAHIGSGNFVNRHCEHNMQIWQHLQPFTWMFTFYWDNGRNVTKLVLIRDVNVPTVVEKSLILTGSLSDQPIETVMHCKGVLAVCFQATYTLLMYNPATRKRKTIHWRIPTLEEDIHVKSVAFGFDDREKSFKYVILTNMANSTRYFFEVYSLKTKEWQQFEAPVEVTDAYTYWNDGVLYDETFCWIIPRKITSQNEPSKLLLFNMSSHSVLHLDLPDGLQKRENDRKKLMQWNNSLAIIFYACKLKSTFSFDIWTLDSSTWTRRATIEPKESFHLTWTRRATIELKESFHPLVFWKPNKLLLQHNLCNDVLSAVPMKSKKGPLHVTCYFPSLF